MVFAALDAGILYKGERLGLLDNGNADRVLGEGSSGIGGDPDSVDDDNEGKEGDGGDDGEGKEEDVDSTGPWWTC